MPGGCGPSRFENPALSVVYQNKRGPRLAVVTPGSYTIVLICKRDASRTEWHGMKILDQLVQDGDRLFRWRSYLPLFFIPIVIAGVMTTAPPFSTRVSERIREAASVAVALAGLLLRVWAVDRRHQARPGARAGWSGVRLDGPGVLVVQPLPLVRRRTKLQMRRWSAPAYRTAGCSLAEDAAAARWGFAEDDLVDQFGAGWTWWSLTADQHVPWLFVRRSAIRSGRGC